MAKTPYTREAMQARLDELNGIRTERMTVLEPLQDELEEMVARHQAEERPLREKIKKAREGLFEIDVERGPLARALGGKSISAS